MESGLNPGVNSIRVRLGTSGDLQWLVQNNLALALESEGLELDVLRVTAGVSAVLSDPGKGFYLVAVEGENPLGQLMITPEWSDWQGGFYWWIQSVYVPPAHRRRGVFRTLFESACLEAEQNGQVLALRLYVDEFNEGARASYRRLGMSPSHYHIFERLL